MLGRVKMSVSNKLKILSNFKEQQANIDVKKREKPYSKFYILFWNQILPSPAYTCIITYADKTCV